MKLDLAATLKPFNGWKRSIVDMFRIPFNFPRALIAVMPAMAGCATTDPLAAWRGEVTRYVTEQGHGDPGVLAELADFNARDSVRPARATIGELGVASKGPNRKAGVRDVQGVLLGSRNFERRRWFLFLVGVTPRVGNAPAETEDIRPAACFADQDSLHWVIGPPNDGALRTYLQPESGRPSHQPFPRDYDDFIVEMAGAEVSIRDRSSGTVWHMTLPSMP